MVCTSETGDSVDITSLIGDNDQGWAIFRNLDLQILGNFWGNVSIHYPYIISIYSIKISHAVPLMSLN